MSARAKYRPYVPANPLVWGAALGIFAAVIIFLTIITGGSPSDNILLTSPAKAGGAFFGFGMLLARFRNWYNT